MTDYYQTLGVSESASPDEIKKAYRSLANKHHPDKGGDQAKFKDISVAYDTLSDSTKKAEYDHQRQYGNSSQSFHSNSGFDPFSGMFGGGGSPFPQGHPFNDIFRGMHRGGGQMRKNRDLNIQCTITFLDSYQGKQLEANYRLPSGKNQNVIINVPAGILHGDTIRYQGLGDDSIPNIQRGDLNVTILVQPDPKFARNGDDIYTTVFINPIEAMIGCRKTIKTISGSDMDLEIRAGVEHGAEFAAGGNGFTNVNTGRKGRFVSVVQIKTPTIIDPVLVARLRDINADISNLP
jgi:curved DNA-binding protein